MSLREGEDFAFGQRVAQYMCVILVLCLSQDYVHMMNRKVVAIVAIASHIDAISAFRLEQQSVTSTLSRY